MEREYFNIKRECGVPGCGNNNTITEDIGYFRLPACKIRSKIWLKKIRRTGYKYDPRNLLYVCEEHFLPLSVNRDVVDRKRLRLRTFAVPQLKLPKAESNGDSTDDEEVMRKIRFSYARKIRAPNKPRKFAHCIITREKLIGTEQTHRVDAQTYISRRRQALFEGKIESTNFDNMLSLADKYSPELINTIIKAQLRLKQIPGHKFTEEFKRFVLSLYHSNTNAYKLLRSALCLPSLKLMKRLIKPKSSMDIPNIMNLLRHKTNIMSDEQRQCILCLEVIDLKQNLYYNIGQDKVLGFHEIDGAVSPVLANRALVLIACGLSDNWKQFISVAALGTMIDKTMILNWIVKVISNLQECEFNCQAMISKMDTAHTFILEENISSQEPFITVNQKKIAIVFDIPSLIINFRNSLMANDFHFEGKVASWDDIAICYYHDCNNSNLRLLPKLTEEHITPSDSQINDLKLAIDVLSLRTGAAISNCIDLQVLKKEAMGTTSLLIQISKLIGLLYSSTKPSAENNIVADNLQFLKQMVRFFEELRIVPKTDDTVKNGFKFVDGFKMTINGLILLHETSKNLNNNMCTKLLCLKRINKYLNKLKVKHSIENPTFRELNNHFKEAFVTDYLKPLTGVETENNIEDFMEKLTKMNIDINEEIKKNVAISKYDDIVIRRDSYNTHVFPNSDNILQIADFIYIQCRQQQRTCYDKTCYRTNPSRNAPRFIVDFVRNMETIFGAFFSKQYIPTNILKGLLEELENVNCELPCECFPVLYSKKLFARLRIFMMLRSKNSK